MHTGYSKVRLIVQKYCKWCYCTLPLCLFIIIKQALNCDPEVRIEQVNTMDE